MSSIVSPAELLELTERLKRSDLGQAEIELVSQRVDELSTRYSSHDPMVVRAEAYEWLARLDRLLDGRLTSRQHLAIMDAVGWLGLLIASLSFDVNDRRSTEAVRRFVVSVGEESNHGLIAAWAHELRAWSALNDGNYERVVVDALAGQHLAPHSDVFGQLAGHEAEALARMGDVQGARRALGKMNEARSRMTIPEMYGHHFQLESQKFDKVEMRLMSLFGDYDDAAKVAQRILDANRLPGERWARPMIAAKAHAALGVQAAHYGDVDAAVANGHHALDIPRQSLPSLVNSTMDLSMALEPFSKQAGVVELRERVRGLAS